MSSLCSAVWRMHSEIGDWSDSEPKAVKQTDTSPFGGTGAEKDASDKGPSVVSSSTQVLMLTLVDVPFMNLTQTRSSFTNTVHGTS